MIKTGKNIALILFAFALLSSCVTAKRCDRKFPPVTIKETIIRDTTIITQTTRFDTITVLNKEIHKDTVFFHDEKTQIKIKYIQLPGDSILISAECPPDTVTITKEIVNNHTVERRQNNLDGRFFWLAVAFIVGLVMIAAGYLTKQIKR